MTVENNTIMNLKKVMYFSAVLGTTLVSSCNDQNSANGENAKKVTAQASVSTDTINAVTTEEQREEQKKAKAEKETKPTAPATPEKPKAPVKPENESEVPNAAETSKSESTTQTIIQEQVTEKKSQAYQRDETKLTAGSIADTAKKIGFGARLPKNTELYFSYQGADSLVKSMINSNVAKAIDGLMPERDKLKNVLEDNDYQQFMSVAGEEVFFAGGEGMSKFSKTFTNAHEGFGSYLIEMLFEEFKADLLIEEEEEDEERFGTPEFFKREDGVVKLFKELELAPLYAGFKVSDAKQRADYLEMLSAGLQEPVQDAPDLFKAIDLKTHGDFSGFKLKGVDVVNMFKTEGIVDQIEADLGIELTKKFLKELARHEFVCLVGEVDDYIVFFAGKTTDQFKLVKKPEESLAANEEAKFLLNYADKKIQGVYFNSKALSASMSGNKIISMYAGFITDILEETDVFGDTREIQELFNKLKPIEKRLSNLFSKSRLGIVSYLEEGYKVDAYLGKNSPLLDLTTPRKLAAMASHKDAVISGSWITGHDYSKTSLELIETLVEASYKTLQIIVEQNFNDDDWNDFSETYKMIDSTFSDDLLRVWKSLKSGSNGLGQEQAFMLDLKGRLPRIPKTPSAILDDGPIPRMAIAMNVKDRAKLSTSWDEIAAAAKDIAGNISKLTEQDIKLPKPERRKAGGLDVWSYQLGVTTKEANTAIGLNDKLFFLTTSPNYIIERASEQKEKGDIPCSELVIRMAPIRTAAKEWLALLDANGEDFLSDNEWEGYNEMKPLFKKIIKASEEIDKVDFHTRIVDGEVRSSMHVKIK